MPELFTVQNNPNATDWNIEDESHANLEEVYPHRVFSANRRDNLFVSLSNRFEKNHLTCSQDTPGFLISLHTPDELPRFSDAFTFIPVDKQLLISIKPHIITTSEGVRRYSPELRKCFFKSERPLRYFKAYSQQKCMLECLANFTKAQCGCVPFYMPSG